MEENKADPRFVNNKAKDHARVKVTVITKLDDLPEELKTKFNGNIKTVVKALDKWAYEPGEIYSLLSSKDSKDNFFLIHPDANSTGGIPWGLDSKGRAIQLFELLSGCMKKNVEDILPGNGSVVGARVVQIPIHEDDLLAVKIYVQIGPAHNNRFIPAEALAATSASIFITAGNHQQVENTYEAVVPYLKVCNLTKLLRDFDRPIADGLKESYQEVTSGDNSLGYFVSNVKGSNQKIPYIVQRCVYSQKNDDGGKNYFFQFDRTELILKTNWVWLKFNCSFDLSQNNSSGSCCVAFLSFLEHHGIAPVHGIESAMHTRFKPEGVIDWNANIGLFRVSLSGISISSESWMNKITSEYNYSLQHRQYPFFKHPVEVQLTTDEQLDIVFGKKLNQLHKGFKKMNSEEKIEMMDIINSMISDLNTTDEDEDEEEYRD